MEYLWNFVTDQLAQNQFLSGGALLAVVGVGFAYLRGIPKLSYDWARRHLVTRVDILDRDEAFKWVLAWLAQHPYRLRCRLVSVTTKNNTDSKTKKSIILSPAPGPHFLFYKRRLVIIRRSRQEGGDLKGGMLGIQEKFDLTIFSRNPTIVRDLLQDAQAIAHPQDENVIKIYHTSWDEWFMMRKQPTRGLDSVILDNHNELKIMEDIKEFHASRDWYTKNGVPYRRGYLLHGPPGNGKTSVVTAIASALHLNVCVLSLTATNLTNENLLRLCSDVPPSSLILIEDVDCSFTERDKDESSVTLSGVLNALDGITATDGRLLFMTTNKYEKLDAALIRPGRCDVTLLFDNATQEQGENLFLHFYPHLPHVAKNFGIQGAGYSMAHLQGLLIQGKKDPENICIN